MIMLEHLIRPLLSRWGSARFPGSQRYWEDRYAQGGTSGPGSSGRLGDFKAQILNSFVRDFEISSVIEFGCGDGHQLSLMNYPLYIGLDTSPTAVALCRARFANDQKKAFILYKPSQRCAQPFPVSADLGLSLDVIYHLVEDSIYNVYMADLFSAARKFVIIYSTDAEIPSAPSQPHIRHRQCSAWIDLHAPRGRLFRSIPNKHPFCGDYNRGSSADFFIYQNISVGPTVSR